MAQGSFEISNTSINSATLITEQPPFANNLHNFSYKQITSARKFVVYDEEAAEDDCQEASEISTLTFLNFVVSSMSIAASLLSNIESFSMFEC